MKFLGWKTLRKKFPEGFIAQARLITPLNSTIDCEGPISKQAFILIISLIAGKSIDESVAEAKSDK